MKDYYVNISIFRADILVLVGDEKYILTHCKKDGCLNKEAFMKLEEHLKEYPIESKNEGRMFEIFGGGSIIWMRKPNILTLIHEITHAVHYLITSKNMTMCRETEELFAYLTEYIFKIVRGDMGKTLK